MKFTTDEIVNATDAQLEILLSHPRVLVGLLADIQASIAEDEVEDAERWDEDFEGRR